LNGVFLPFLVTIGVFTVFREITIVSGDSACRVLTPTFSFRGVFETLTFLFTTFPVVTLLIKGLGCFTSVFLAAISDQRGPLTGFLADFGTGVLLTPLRLLRGVLVPLRTGVRLFPPDLTCPGEWGLSPAFSL